MVRYRNTLLRLGLATLGVALFVQLGCGDDGAGAGQTAGSTGAAGAGAGRASRALAVRLRHCDWEALEVHRNFSGFRQLHILDEKLARSLKLRIPSGPPFVLSSGESPEHAPSTFHEILRLRKHHFSE